jgi:hypothetical protein
MLPAEQSSNPLMLQATAPPRRKRVKSLRDLVVFRSLRLRSHGSFAIERSRNSRAEAEWNKDIMIRTSARSVLTVMQI